MGIFGNIDYIFNKTYIIGRVKISASMRSTKSPMGRFGGGWDWKLGFMKGGKTVIISLLVMDVRISWNKKEK